MIKNQSAFTLFEILIALAIITILFLVTIQSNARVITNSEYLKKKTLAHWVAMNLAAQLEIEETWEPVGSRKGTMQQGKTLWLWSLQNKSTSDDTVHKVSITVSEQSNPLEILDSISLYRSKPIVY